MRSAPGAEAFDELGSAFVTGSLGSLGEGNGLMAITGTVVPESGFEGEFGIGGVLVAGATVEVRSLGVAAEHSETLADRGEDGFCHTIRIIEGAEDEQGALRVCLAKQCPGFDDLPRRCGWLERAGFGDLLEGHVRLVFAQEDLGECSPRDGVVGCELGGEDEVGFGFVELVEFDLDLGEEERVVWIDGVFPLRGGVMHGGVFRSIEPAGE